MQFVNPFVHSQITAYPGQTINISIFSYDEQNFTTPDTVQIMGSNYDSVCYNTLLCAYSICSNIM